MAYKNELVHGRTDRKLGHSSTRGPTTSGNAAAAGLTGGPDLLGTAEVLGLQRLVGNAAAARVVRSTCAERDAGAPLHAAIRQQPAAEPLGAQGRAGREPAGNPVVAHLPEAPTVQRWTEDEVYTAIRDRIPAWRRALVQAQEEQSPLAVRAVLTPLLSEVRAELNNAQRGGMYRLGRTYDYAATAVETLALLRDHMSELISTAQIRIRIEEDLDKHDEVSRLYREMLACAKRMGVEAAPRQPTKEQRARAYEAEGKVSTELLPGHEDLESFRNALAFDKDSYEAEITRLKDAEPTVMAYVKAKITVEGTLADIDLYLSETIYDKNRLQKEFKSAKGKFDLIVMPLGKARGLIGPHAVANLQTATPKLVGLDVDLTSKDGLGVSVEDAHGRRVGKGTGSRGQRTSLPIVTSALAGDHRASMLVDAVREARKTPEWQQAAIDFVLGRLALGRGDHIHICGGGNTLIYRDRLIRGFINEHLDSRPESQLKANKIKGRFTDKPVPVAVREGSLFEIVG